MRWGRAVDGGITAWEVPGEDRTLAVFSTGPMMGLGFAPCCGGHGHLLEVGASPGQDGRCLGWTMPLSIVRDQTLGRCGSLHCGFPDVA